MTTTTITNPILTGMYPDPSWMWDADHGRIAMVNSSFELVPGLPIHTSDDLGRWIHVSDAIDEAMARRLLIPFVEDSGGVYAPTLRRIGGRYVIVCTIARINEEAARRGGVTEEELAAAAKAEGNFAIVADELEGPWSGPYWIEGAEGIDPDIFEDCDGAVYWTQTRPALDPQWEGQTEIWTQRIDPETWTLINDGQAAGDGRTVIWRGYGVDAVWAEGPHLYRIGDYVYLFTAEGGTSFEHSEMAMRVFAPQGLKAAIETFRADIAEAGVAIPAPREGEHCLLGTHDRLFHANKKNPILTHRHLGLNEPVQCVGHGDILHHPTLGWWMVSLGVRETKGANPGELLSYLGREPFIAPMTWEHNPSSWKLDGGGAPTLDPGDPGWPVVAPGLGRMPERVTILDAGTDIADNDPAIRGMTAVADDRTAHVFIGLDDAGSRAAAARPVLDADREADLTIRDETGIRYARITADDILLPVPDGGMLVIRQNSTHLVTICHGRGDGRRPAGVTCTFTEDGVDDTRTYGPLPDGCTRVAVLMRRNELTVLAYDGTRDVAGLVEEAIRGGEPDGCLVMDRRDARFLSTEWSGGFVGCLAGVPTGTPAVDGETMC